MVFPVCELLNSFQIKLLSFSSLIQLAPPPSEKTNVVTFKIDMDSLHKDLGNCSFSRCPGNTVNILRDQYLGDLSKLLDKHAPLITCSFTKEAAGWLSDSYQL